MMSDEKGALLADRVRLCDGQLFWVRSGQRVALFADRDGYLTFTIRLRRPSQKSVYYAAHRAIWFLHYGAWPKHTIDHINHVRDDNRISNLRDVTQRENTASRLISRQGVRPADGKWRVEVYHDGERIHLGMFTNKVDAERRRNEFLREIGGGIPLPATDAQRCVSRARVRSFAVMA